MLLLVVLQDGRREVVAVKRVDKSSLSKSAVDNIVTEIYLLKILRHENIVEMRDFFWDEGLVPLSSSAFRSREKEKRKREKKKKLYVRQKYHAHAYACVDNVVDTWAQDLF